MSLAMLLYGAFLLMECTNIRTCTSQVETTLFVRSAKLRYFESGTWKEDRLGNLDTVVDMRAVVV